MNKGYLKISNELYVSQWHEIYVFMKDFRPTHIEFRPWENNTWYLYGVSKMFHELKEGDKVPQYHLFLQRHENKAMTYEFILVKLLVALRSVRI